MTRRDPPARAGNPDGAGGPVGGGSPVGRPGRRRADTYAGPMVTVAQRAASWGERVGGFFALDDDWERGRRLDRNDLFVGGLMLLLSLITLELVRSMGGLEELGQPAWVPWVAVVLGAGILVGRRRWPLTVTVLAGAHMFVVGVTMPVVMGQVSMQIVYFCAIFSGAAWARSRREMLVVVGCVIALMFLWVAWQFALGTAVENILGDLDEDADRDFGLVSPITGAVLTAAIINALFFFGALVAGQMSWRGAQQRARLAEQAELLREQGETLRSRAVIEERLRIARELHDVVAHHVSVIGINAGAARRVIDRDPAGAAQALGQIEESSREAVGQMRGLLGALRAPETADQASSGGSGGSGGNGDRSPEPGLDDLPALVAAHDSPGLDVTYRLVEEPHGVTARVSPPVALSIYRTAQEALANVRRHSTATRATVVVRVEQSGDGGYAELEVTDDGRARHGTSGSGLGHLGIRERVASLRGEVDIGPRVTGGYRVRVRLPFAPSPQPAPPMARTPA
jgi:signal transduction histidine kinase